MQESEQMLKLLKNKVLSNSRRKTVNVKQQKKLKQNARIKIAVEVTSKKDKVCVCMCPPVVRSSITQQ